MATSEELERLRKQVLDRSNWFAHLAGRAYRNLPEDDPIRVAAITADHALTQLRFRIDEAYGLARIREGKAKSWNPVEPSQAEKYSATWYDIE